MKTSIAAAALALAAICFTSCKPSHPESAAEPEAPAVPEFSEKHGLSMPEQTRQSIGLKLVEVTEQKLVSSIPLELRIYGKEATSAFATGSVSPDVAKWLRAGQTLEIQLPDGKQRSGKVIAVGDTLREVTGALEVLVEIPDVPDSLTLGAFVQAAATRESDGDVATVPRAAVLESSEGPFVYTVSGDHFVRTPVKIGATNGESVEIADGLYAGDQVVLQPVMSLWMTELAAVKGGQACCIEMPKGK